MRFFACCVSLLLVLMVCFPTGYAFAESMSATDGSPILTVSNTRNTAVDQQAVGPQAAIYTSTVRAGAGAHPDTGEVKPVSSPQESPPSPSKPKTSFWQRLNGRKVDCSSGVCIVK
jgi:hypothetical protein